MVLGSMLVDGGFAENVIAMTSSHFCSAERQFRFPLELGNQRPPTAQWTVTGAGAALICRNGTGPKILACTMGTVTDLGINDANNMGPAMAPAALKTIRSHFEDLGVSADEYDLIVTGDLGQLGKDVLLTLAQKEGLGLGGKLVDCGTLIFDLLKQDVHSGGSGCGCSAVVLCGYLLDSLLRRKLRKILFCGTGALLSPVSVQQGLPIPGVCHAVSICGGH
jgi:stage V sporulation protein AD